MLAEAGEPVHSLLPKIRQFNANAIVPRLWIGSAPRDVGDVAGFDVLFLCAQEYQPSAALFPGVHVFRVLLHDDGRRMGRIERLLALQAAKHVGRAYQAGLRILVTCWMGLNRSSLVTGLALEGPPMCFSSEQVEYKIRRARGERALSNADFVSLLREQSSKMC
jgi:hypothetical protein